MSDPVQPPAPPGQRQRRNILLLYALAALTAISHGSMELIFPLNLNRLEHPLQLIGATVALIGFGSLVSRVPGGAWYRFSQARMLIASTLGLMGLSTIGLGLGNQWGLQAVLGATHGLAYGLSTTFLLALLIELRPRGENPAPSMAWYTAALSSGYAISAPYGAQAIERFSHEIAFALSGLAGLAGAALALALRLPSAQAADSVSDRSQRAATSSRRFGSLATLPAGVWLAALLSFYINFISDAYQTFFPIYAIGLGISVGAIGFLKSVHSLAATFIRFSAAALLRFIGLGVANHVSVLCMAAGVVALSLTTSETVLAVVFVVLGTCRGLIRVTSATMVAEERSRPGASVGMASGVYNAGLDAGSMLGPPVAGFMASILDIPTTFRIMALAVPAVYYVVWFAQRARSGRAPATGPATSG